ncbi:MAG: gliding motility-associated C-terminal domain-containing protein, partial [Ignavibacteriales bacterium]|nr:gliding motility-associated C-terminal domain-containing protein [Ignavibacteriales bacterium]
WKGNIPTGTRITMQVRTGNTPAVDAKWSPWSDEITVPNSLFDIYEPRQYMQYRVHLYTATIETPRLDEVTISYDTDLVAKTTTAKILPQSTPILKEGQFQYQVSVESDARSQGIDTLVIFTKIPLAVSSAKVNDSNVPFNANITAGRVAIGFGSTINSNVTISIGLKFTPFLDETAFPSAVISKQNPSNPQRVDATITNGNESWTLLAIGVPEQIIVDATADPNPFTPNGDGKNDVTYISFFVSNLVAERPITVKIYDVSGRIVRTLLETKSTAQAYVEQNALRWDGRNDNGTLLPPGLYIYQIIVDVDGLSPAVVTKTVSIAY